MLAAVVGVTVAAGLLQNAAAALGTLAGHLDDQRFCEGALRIAGAGQEPSEPSGFDDHLLAADVADLIGKLVGNLDPLAVQVLFRLLQLSVESLIETVEHILPVLLARLHCVQVFLHFGGESGVHHVLELILHEPSDHFAQGGGAKGASLFHHIFPGQNGGHGGGIGGGAADALFL